PRLLSSLFFLVIPRPPTSALFPYTTLFRSGPARRAGVAHFRQPGAGAALCARQTAECARGARRRALDASARSADRRRIASRLRADRKSTRLNSSHVAISYAVFCLKKKRTLI